MYLIIKVTAVIPTYERTEELKRALQSVITQTFQEMEVMVVDDNPSEEYRKKVEAVVNEISGKTGMSVKRVVNEDKQGVSSARNLGIEKASAKYIAFLDDDDEWKPEKVEKQVEKIENGEFGAVYTASEMYNGEVNDIVRRAQDLDLNSLLERDRIGSPSKAMIETEWLEKIDGFDEEIPSAEDWDLWIRLVKEGCKFGYIDEPLTRYNQDNGSKSSQMEIATEGRDKITEKYSKLLEEAGKKVKARHHLNRAKKQYQLRDDSGTRRHLSKALRNNPLELEAYALSIIYLTKRFTGINLINLAAEIKGRIK